jgi:hypothetical protein
MWIDIPGVLGRGYRTYLYEHLAGLQPDCVIMMNSGLSDGSNYNVSYAWPADLIAIERNLPPATGHVKWRTIEGKRYYLPGEVNDPIGKEWFYEDSHREPAKGSQSASRCGAEQARPHFRRIPRCPDVSPQERGLVVTS